MRILVVDPGFEYSTLAVAEGYYKAFERLGYEVMEYNTYEYLQKLKPGILSNSKSWNEVTETLSSPIINLVIQHKIDFVLVIHGFHVNPSVVISLRKLGCKTGIILTDEPQQVDESVKWSQYYDFVFTNDRNTKMIHNNCHFMPMAVNDHIFQQNEVEEKYRSDILFGGSFYAERIAFMDEERFCERLEKYDVKCVGACKYEFQYDDPRVEWFVANKIDIATMSVFVKGTKVSVDIPRNEFRCGIFGEANKEYGIVASCLSPRIFECFAAGAFPLTSNKRLDIVELFNGFDIPTYTDHDSFYDLIDKLLCDDVYRTSFVETGKEYVLDKHTYVKRVEEIATIVGMNPTKKVIRGANIINDTVVRNFNKDWGINVKRMNQFGLYVDEHSIVQDRMSKRGETAIVVGNSVSLETYAASIPEGNRYCMNASGHALDMNNIAWDNLVIIHPEENVTERSVDTLNWGSISGKTMYASTVAHHRAAIDWVCAGGRLRLFSTGNDGHKAIPEQLFDVPRLNAGTTVAYSMLEVLKYLGYSRIEIYGLDFCYLNYRRYAYESYRFDDMKQNMFTVVRDGLDAPVLTDDTSITTVECVKKFVAENKDIEFVYHGPGLLSTFESSNLRIVI